MYTSSTVSRLAWENNPLVGVHSLFDNNMNELECPGFRCELDKGMKGLFIFQLRWCVSDEKGTHSSAPCVIILKVQNVNIRHYSTILTLLSLQYL